VRLNAGEDAGEIADRNGRERSDKRLHGENELAYR
jgi:hypothetical protein